MGKGVIISRVRETGRHVPLLDVSIVLHLRGEFAVDVLHGGHEVEGAVEEVVAQSLVADVADVVVTLQLSPGEVVDAVNHGDAHVLYATQEVLEGDQVSERNIKFQSSLLLPLCG